MAFKRDSSCRLVSLAVYDSSSVVDIHTMRLTCSGVNDVSAGVAREDGGGVEGRSAMMGETLDPTRSRVAGKYREM